MFSCVCVTKANVYLLHLRKLLYQSLFVSFAPQGKEIIEYHLKQLEEEGITHMPRWVPPPIPTTPHQPPVSSARAIPACSSRVHPSSTDVLPGSPDGEMNHTAASRACAHKYNNVGGMK